MLIEIERYTKRSSSFEATPLLPKPQPEIRNPKPQTPNPKPQIQNLPGDAADDAAAHALASITRIHVPV